MSGDDLITDPPASAFHDYTVYGIAFIAPDPEHDDWRSELVLDIDHILEWIRTADGRFRFRLVRANLRFENVSDLRVTFAFPGSTLTPLPIDRIERSNDADLVRTGTYQEFLCTIYLNDMAGGTISFRSTGYRLQAIGTPDEYANQFIPPSLRRP